MLEFVINMKETEIKRCIMIVKFAIELHYTNQEDFLLKMIYIIPNLQDLASNKLWIDLI